MSNRVVPVRREFVVSFLRFQHRHSGVPVSYLFALGLAGPDNAIHGICVVERPKARCLDDGWTVEASRVCTDGAKNGCSMLLGRAWKIAKLFGYLRMVTYTLERESGASMRALSGQGWTISGKVKAREWTTPSRPREIGRTPEGGRIRWEVSDGWTPQLPARFDLCQKKHSKGQIALFPAPLPIETSPPVEVA